MIVTNERNSMCQRNTNKLRTLALLGVLVAVVFISGCTQVPQEEPAEGQPSITTPTEKSTITLPKGTSAGKIAFTSAEGGVESVFVINYDGTGKAKLVEGQFFQWSSNGKTIVYRHDGRFYVINYDGTGKIDFGVNYPILSPDGRIIAITNIPISEEYMVYGWSPDGKKIAYINKHDNLIVINADGTNKIRLTPLVYNLGYARPYSIQWSPDSKKIAYGYGFINADGSGNTNLTGTEYPLLSAVWSPDGKMIAYRNGQLALAVMRVNERKVVAQVTIPYGHQFSIEDFYWTPDGKTILYNVRGGKTYNAEVRSGYHVLEIENGRITYIDYGVYPQFSPDGKRILYLRPDGGGIYVINADGTGKISLGDGEYPKWSYDSTKIVYQYTEKFGKEVVGKYIYVVNADGTGKIKLTEGQNPVPSPATK